MTRIGRRLIEDFLLPALNDGRYGDLLKWIDRDKRYFSIRWSHKNAAKWTLADTAVFQAWDQLKGHYHPEVKGYYMQAKQRFRAALYKLNTVRKLPCEDKHVKKYQLVLNPDRRHHEIMRKSRKPAKYTHKEENQKSIPTPVICKHSSFVVKPKEENYAEESTSSSSPASPASSIKSEESVKLEELEKCLEEYQLAHKEHYMQNSAFKYQELLIPKSESMDCESMVLRESPDMNMVRRTPHVPIQPVPVYNKCNFRQAIENSQKRVESPHVLLVRTYNDSDSEVDIPEIKEEKIDEEADIKHDKDCAENKKYSKNSEGALNLSTKSDNCFTVSR